MFISKEYLHRNLGVDTDIAAFFVDRKVPVNNLYWRDRLLYISRGTGYLFIPLFFDLQYRCGVPKQTLLDEDYVALMENILHVAARHEFENINFDDVIDSCKQVMLHKVNNQALYNDLLHYFSNGVRPHNSLGTFSKALNRGDMYLFSLCYLNLPLSDTSQIIAQWYALVPSFLLMDDIMDLQDDQRNNEENAISDFGKGNVGVERAINYLRTNFRKLKDLNLLLGEHFERSLESKLQTTYLKTLLNE